jgi:hypothetical protein
MVGSSVPHRVTKQAAHDRFVKQQTRKRFEDFSHSPGSSEGFSSLLSEDKSWITLGEVEESDPMLSKGLHDNVGIFCRVSREIFN